jgi:hypothetical protein
VNFNKPLIANSVVHAVEEIAPAELANLWTPNFYGENIFHYIAEHNYGDTLEVRYQMYSPPNLATFDDIGILCSNP